MSEQSGRAFTDAKDAQAVAQLRELLNTVWRITLKADERVFLGKFMVVDRQRNVILDETVEESGGRTRNVGLVMIPGSNIKTAEVDRDSLVM